MPMLLPKIPPRAPDSHKGDFGAALLIGGSRGMSGAISLSGTATLRSGAGLVKIATPAGCQTVVAAHQPAYMTIALQEDAEGRFAAAAIDSLIELCEQATIVACGPGMGRSTAINELVRILYRDLPRPALFDADALNALATQPDILDSHAGPRVLTPHPGEFARLIGRERFDVAERESLATQFVAQYDVTLVLKGHRTVVADRQKLELNQTGNPGMATGGAGDVLTGIITGLLCQELSPWDAARLGVHLHGLAGDLAAADLGQISLIAGDLIDYLPRAFRELSKQQEKRKLGFGA